MSLKGWRSSFFEVYYAVFIHYTTAVTRFHSLYHSLSLFVICCHLLYHSFSLVVPVVVTRFTTSCHLFYHSLSFVIIRCTTRCHSLSLAVTRYTAPLSFLNDLVKAKNTTSFETKSTLDIFKIYYFILADNYLNKSPIPPNKYTFNSVIQYYRQFIRTGTFYFTCYGNRHRKKLKKYKLL